MSTIPVYASIATSKQRVIDRFTVGYGSMYQFKLSVEPYGFPAAPDIVVNVNGVEVKSATSQINGYTVSTINGSPYVNLENYLTSLLTTTQSQPPVVEVDTYTHGLLDPAAPGYFQIPQQLNANPTQQEVGEISASDLINQFASIIKNQPGFSGAAIGGPNNYRDTVKNNSLGSFILQNVTPALKSMLISSDSDLDFISDIRFSQDEYTKFKNKYITVAQQLINQEFSPIQYHNNTVVVNAWVDTIIKTVNVSKEFSNAFAYSYMIANGTPFATQTNTLVSPTDLISILPKNYVDLNDPRNALYVYNNNALLLIGIDYEIISTNNDIIVQFLGTLPINSSIIFNIYKNPIPAYIPSTPAKIGASSVYIPRMEWDTSYTIPTWVIIGHDGSKSIAYGTYDPVAYVFSDHRDSLLVELEKRIYNLLQYRFRNEYYLPIRIEEVKSGYFRDTRYSKQEYLDITESYLNKWCAKNRANYRNNDWATASADLPPNSAELWKLYNYSSAVSATTSSPLNLPGNWKGIFQFYYDTIFPDTRPWEMLGFSSMPSWWIRQYGNNWTSTNTALWSDLEAGIIRQGPSAIYDPITLTPQSQSMWARPGLANIIPVDTSGNIIPVPTLFNIAMSGNLYAPFDGFDHPWVYGDGGPVEQAWMATSGYVFSTQEFLYLMRPASYGELMFDTIGTSISAGMLLIDGIDGPVMSTTNWQYVQNDTYTNADPTFAWMRPKNSTQIVHAETVDNVVQVKYGYQRWISDNILFLGKDVSATFGQKVRTLDVNLANKLAGFTNKDTTTTYIEAVSTASTTTSLLIPTNNFDVILHKSQPVKTYSYSGVIIRLLADGTFAVYGYDLLNSAFTVLDRSPAQLIDITIGGTPASFEIYTLGVTYTLGQIVRYNGVYYAATTTIVAGKFDSTAWQKLRSLPTTGGISVVYQPISDTTYKTIPYGSILNTVQDVFNLLIGWGAYLETQGWQFTDVSTDTNQISDWLYCAKQFLFWLNTSWAPDASIQLSPAANNAILTVATGYPDDVETISNGVYSILDKYGAAIPPSSTYVNRDAMTITVQPTDLSVGGIYFLQISASQTEHILIFDNTTSFNDTIYDPLLQARQQRLRFNGFRSNGWYGKQEAPGYLIIDNQLVPNFDTIVDEMRYYYDPDVTIDNPSIEAMGRHLIGYESKSYLDNLQLPDNIQYLFYQGAIRQKGTIQSFDKLFRSTSVQHNEVIEIYEEWALKLGNFGNTIEQVSTEFILLPEQNTGEVIVARLNFKPSAIGSIKEINILNSENIYSVVPKIIIDGPNYMPEYFTDYSFSTVYQQGNIVRGYTSAGTAFYSYINAVPSAQHSLVDTDYWALDIQTIQATAYAVLDSSGLLSRVDILNPGYGYTSAAGVSVESSMQIQELDLLYSVWQGEIVNDTVLDNIIEIDIDDTTKWIVRPANPTYSLEFPTTPIVEYSIPNAGYVNFDDINWSVFSPTELFAQWGTSFLNPVANETIWVAKTFTTDWDVLKLVNIKSEPYMANPWKIIENPSGNLTLLTAPVSTPVGLYAVPPAPVTAYAILVNGYVSTISVLVGGSDYTIAPTVELRGGSGSGATAVANITNGTVTSITITSGGLGYVDAPTVYISASPTGVSAVASAKILSSIQINSNTSGFFTLPPTVTITGDSPDPATAIAQINSNGILTSISTTPPSGYAGSGYSVVPTITIGEPVTVLQATLTPIISNGSIVDVTIVDPGKGYTVGTSILAIRVNEGASGEDAIITVSTTGPSGEILGVTIYNSGSGYIPLPGELIVPQLSTIPGERTDLGSIICFQVNAVGVTLPSSNYVMMVQPPQGSSTTNPWAEPLTYTDPLTGVVYYSYDLLHEDGTNITSSDIGIYADFTDLFLFKTMRWQSIPPQNMLPTYVTVGDLVWADNTNGKWGVYNITSTSGQSYYTIHRLQENLINTSLFENAQVYQTLTQTELVLLPVYDPFKGILPALAKQNLSYIVAQDPARYNVTGNNRLFSLNIVFGESQVGKLWWDLSSVAYVYYEQPLALDGTETPTTNLAYRRDNWGRLFPGSIVNIYEWTKSSVPPALYTGTGTPRDTTTYVQIITSNTFTNVVETNYYFWVLNPTTKPNIENRTLSAVEVGSLLATPKSLGFSFFCPIQQTSNNNSYMFYNVQEILAYQGDNIQIQYRVAERNDQAHTQWMFFREGDASSLVTSQYWDKMVDSLCGYTDLLPISTEWANGIIIAKYLLWNEFEWNITPWNDATDTTTPVYGVVLPVPDPALGEFEKLGINYRPRQSMFSDVYKARKILYQSGNNLLKYIPIRNDNPLWNNGSDTDPYQGIYWDYVDWYEVGYENVTPNVVFSTLAEAQAALTTNQLKIGSIVEVINGSVDGTRFTLYAVEQLNSNVPTLSLTQVGAESCAIAFLPSIYTVQNVYSLSEELRNLLNTLRTTVMINANVVDQNELFFSMLNFVISEQKSPDWLFKSSYIYIKENNIPLTQDKLYQPNQIENIISYITDAKPYHTQIRDYTNSYTTSDISTGTAADGIKDASGNSDGSFVKKKDILQFGPSFSGPYAPGSWDADNYVTANTLAWDHESWDVNPENYSYVLTAGGITSQETIAQLVSTETVFTIPLTNYDSSKIGFSQLFPYTFNISTENDPQTFITPANVINVIAQNAILQYGKDYYVEMNTDGSYTAYFYKDPGQIIIPQAVVLWDAGGFLEFTFGSTRTEIAYGYAFQDFVINVDTMLPVNDVSNVPSLAPATIAPYAKWGDAWGSVSGQLATEIVAAGGTPLIPWNSTSTLTTLPNTISFKEHLNVEYGPYFYRNANISKGALVSILPAITSTLDTVAVFVDPATHSVTDILPDPARNYPGVIWIDGERIEYNTKSAAAGNTWILGEINRGTMGTIPATHIASSYVFVEQDNLMTMFDINSAPWNTVNNAGSNTVPAGGLWYANTAAAMFLKDKQGNALR